jgi:hypothetical protein
LSFLPSVMFWSQANDEKKNRDILKFLREYDDIFDGNLYDAFAVDLILFYLLGGGLGFINGLESVQLELCSLSICCVGEANDEKKNRDILSPSGI